MNTEAPAAPTAPIAVAIVSWNTRDLLAKCLRSLRADFEARRADVWVVDNGSTDGSIELVREDFPWVSLIVAEANLGYGPAVNVVARRTGHAWIAPSNADIEVTTGALEGLLIAGERDPGAGVVAPKLILPDGSVQPSIQPYPGFWTTLLKHLRFYKLSRAFGEQQCLAGFWDPDRPQRVEWATGAFFVVRREAYERIGGFDESQWMYSEDLDLCWRAREAGWATRFEPGALVHHALSVAAAQAFGDDAARRAKWMTTTYAWIARRRGVRVAWGVAGLNFLVAASRYAAFTGLSRRRPSDFDSARERSRAWMRLHRTGLRSRAALVEPERTAAQA